MRSSKASEDVGAVGAQGLNDRPAQHHCVGYVPWEHAAGIASTNELE